MSIRLRVKKNTHLYMTYFNAQASTSSPKIVRVKGDVLSSKDISRGANWVTELQTTVANSADKKVYLVSNVLPTEGIYNFVKDLRSNLDFASIR